MVRLPEEREDRGAGLVRLRQARYARLAQDVELGDVRRFLRHVASRIRLSAALLFSTVCVARLMANCRRFCSRPILPCAVPTVSSAASTSASAAAAAFDV